MPDYKADGWLGTCIETIREIIRDPSTNAEYTDDKILKHYLEPGWAQIYSAYSQSDGGPILASYNITPVEKQQFYDLPPHTRRVIMVGMLNAEGIVTSDWMPRSELNPHGPMWAVNGTQLELRPYPRRTFTDPLTILYIPDSDVRLHEGVGTVVDASTFTLAATPTFGRRDKRANSYGGMLIRIEQASLTLDYEFTVSTYDATTRQCTIRGTMAAELISAGTVQYSIAPYIPRTYTLLLAQKVALDILATQNGTREKYGKITEEFRKGLKTLRDSKSYIQARVPRRFSKDVRGAGGMGTSNLGRMF